MDSLFKDRFQDDLIGINSCFDRLLVSDTLIPLSYAKGMGQFWTMNGILMKEFQSYNNSLSESLKEHPKGLAETANLPYIYLNNSRTRKETLLKSLLETRGQHPGLITVLSSLWKFQVVLIHIKIEKTTS